MIENMLKYQDADAGLRKIEIELSGNEARKKAVSAKKYLESVEENITKLDVKAAELAHIFESLQAESKLLDEQREEFMGAIEQAEDENALAYLSKKTDELYNKIKSLSQEAAKVADAMQAVYKEYAGIRSNVKAAQTQYSDNVKIYNELKASRQDEMKRIEDELKTLEKDVDAGLLERYKAKRKNKIFPILFEAKGDFCGACNMELPKSTLSRLKNGEIIECDQCGRLLYLKK